MSEIGDNIRSGNRRAIGKAITLIESSRADHQKEAQELLSEILPHTGNTIRIGMTGVPGVGKSTFIESFGKMLTSMGIKVAVLAVDPSSQITGGSILGDKTRMEELARDDMAFIRPTPSKGTLGGTARYTREAMMVLEAAGYDVIIVETVGVGQSEVAVADLVDMFVLLLSPGGGDELQGIKRGIMELADLIIINKADGDFINSAKIAAADCRNALHLMKAKSSDWVVDVLEISALNKTGLENIWQKVCLFKDVMKKNGSFEQRREQQDVSAIWSELNELILDKIKQQKPEKLKSFEQLVKNKKITPLAAAEELLRSTFGE
tara:strand:+ start:145781 stop:146743 length:963 start_codon:yes stop_codon:yes gene_type:complete